MDFDVDLVKRIIDYYKDKTNDGVVFEADKWKALKCFYDNWDINSKNFYTMLEKSLSKSKKLLSAKHFYPKNTILYFARKDPEAVREMFVNLFNETISLSMRVSSFIEASDRLFDEYKPENSTKHYQNLNSIAVYLFFRFPNKYYLYRENKFKVFAKNINYKIPKKGGLDLLNSYYKMCDELLDIVKNDEALVDLSENIFKNAGIKDKSLHLITEDLIYVGSLLEEHKINLYTKKDFLNEVYIDEAKYERLVRLLNRKRNIIIQGAPGVGKTFLSKLLAYSIIGERDDKRVEFVQFHQNYSYEDFVLGYKPSKDGFELSYGVFYEFCKRAAEDLDNEYFFIIDEINRGNISKIFGELMMLIEQNYRGVEINLAYGNIKFTVSQNIYIIGLMNTADRSIAIIDYALRRRFSFFDLKPAFDNDRFLNYINSFKSKKLNNLIDSIKNLNKDIKSDYSLGEGFLIGHSYFLGNNGLKNIENCTEEGRTDLIDELLYDIVEFDLIPLLREYWFDDFDKVDKWSEILRETLSKV